MRGLMRVLIMFGPMIFRQFKKMQQEKERRASRRPQQDKTFRQNRNPADSMETRTKKPQPDRATKPTTKVPDATVEKPTKSYDPDDMVAPAGEKKGWSIKDIFFKDV